MSTRWRHVVCAQCFLRMNPETNPQVPGLLPENEEFKICCYCVNATLAWFFVRAAPELVPCQGYHFERRHAGGNRVVSYPPQWWDWAYGLYVVLAVGAHVAVVYWKALRDKLLASK